MTNDTRSGGARERVEQLVRDLLAEDWVRSDDITGYVDAIMAVRAEQSTEGQEPQSRPIAFELAEGQEPGEEAEYVLPWSIRGPLDALIQASEVVGYSQACDDPPELMSQQAATQRAAFDDLVRALGVDPDTGHLLAEGQDASAGAGRDTGGEG